MSRVIIGFDCAGPHVAAGIWRGDALMSQGAQEMRRGQGEALMPLLEAQLAKTQLRWCDVDVVAVGVGPGNFTGIRIAVSAARGLALGLDKPVIGISAFACLKGATDGLADEAAELRVLPAPRDQAYGQLFKYGWPVEAPFLFDPAMPPERARQPNLVVLGHRAQDIASRLDAEHRTRAVAAANLPARVLENAAWQLAECKDLPAPAPLYVKPADAAPPRDAPPVLID